MRNVAGYVLRSFLTLALLASAVALAMSPQFYVFTALTQFLWLALASTVILHLLVRPFWADVVYVLLSTLLLSLIAFRTMAFPAQWRVACSFLGVSSLVILGCRSVWAEGRDRKMLLRAFVPALLFIGIGWLTPPALSAIELLRPRTYDLYLYSFDCSLRVQLSFLLGVAFGEWPWLKAISMFFYLGLSVPIALVYAEQLVRNKEKALPIMLALLYCGPLGMLFYTFFPAFGPINLFQQDFPLHPLTIAQAARLQLESIVHSGPRNAMPSLHMAWVVLLWWYARGLSWWTRATALAFVVFTVLSTLGLGEHYFVDLVVAFPFALMIRAIFLFSFPWRNKERVSAFLVGILGTFAWLGLLRFAMPFFWLSPMIPWAFVAATIVVVWVQEKRLLRHTQPEVEVTRQLRGGFGRSVEETPSTAID